MSESLRILFIADGSSIHTVRWLRFFVERGHSVGLVSVTPPASGLQVNQYFHLSPRSPLPFTRLLRNLAQTRRALATFKPDVLHAHYINEAGWLAAASGFRPFMITAWGSDVYQAPRESLLAAKASPWSVRRADWVTADSKAQVRALCTMGVHPERCSAVNWGVEMASFDEARLAGSAFRAKYELGPDDLLILAPRQWIENSNIDVVVDAFALVREKFPGARLFLKRMKANPHEYSSRIEAQIARLRLSGAVHVLEEMPEVDVPTMYAAADIMISICTSDGTPVSLLEAMAARCAVVVSDLPDLAEWVENGTNGFRVPARDTRAATQSLERLLSNAALRTRLGAAGRRIAEARANRSQNLLQIEAMYRRLANQNLAH